ncbi:MAG: hypothetical protein RLO04_10065 [Limnobacter sp.]|uniref:hypothetical protein n=1 Tax=Limnobacter sp. TaxID=2003368 RepID=UPI0032EC5F99
MPAVLDYVPIPTVPAIYSRVDIKERPRHFPEFMSIGTGGERTTFYLVNWHAGYGKPIEVIETPATEKSSAYSAQMMEIQEGFGRNMSRLPAVFGVSRQALYGWLSGDKIPKESHHAKLEELAQAARVFKAAGFKPTRTSLGRTVRDGMSLLELIEAGCPGKESAQQLVRLVTKGSQKANRLADMLADQGPKASSPVKMGLPHLDNI